MLARQTKTAILHYGISRCVGKPMAHAKIVDAIGYAFFAVSQPEYRTQSILATVMCALIVLYFAKSRFDQVATQVDWGEFSKRTRVWTSRPRYYGALILYGWL